ncbi:MAG: serine hydrolase [Clostridia bacterium]|nr:serine hydrolase [Clostridia bacterium]MBQ4619987.1 serine hydrolase [Clostridia bacterium]
MEFKRSTPGRLGISPKAVTAFLNAVNDKELGLHSFMLIRHGEVAAEGWWKPYSPDYVHMLFSLSKSFTSTAVGFTCQEGLLSIDKKVVSFFKDELPANPCENMMNMTVRNLLTMGTGHSKEPNALNGEKWAYNFLTSYVDKTPGSIFTYNTPATYMLSRIVQKVTGEKVFDYLKPRLFDVLGIKDIWWEESPEGANTGGFGLNLHTEDIAKFGQFLLNKGNVDGKQILNPEWIDMATSKQISNGDPNEDSDWSQGYGFQFWRCKRDGVYRGDGAFGQYCVVMPKQDAVLAVTSGSNDIGQILNEAWTHLLPAMDEPTDDDGLDEMNDVIQSLSIPLPEGSKSVNIENAEYNLAVNPLGLKTLKVTCDQTSAKLTLTYWQENTYQKNEEIPFGFGEWIENGEGFKHTFAACAAQEDGSIRFKFILADTPFIREVTLLQNGDFAEISIRQNVGFQPMDLYLIGKKTK